MYTSWVKPVKFVIVDPDEVNVMEVFETLSIKTAWLSSYIFEMDPLDAEIEMLQLWSVTCLYSFVRENIPFEENAREICKVVFLSWDVWSEKAVVVAEGVNETEYCEVWYEFSFSTQNAIDFWFIRRVEVQDSVVY